MLPLRREILQQVFDQVFGAPQITVADIADELRKMLRHDPMKAESAVGSLYGHVFKRKEAALNPWQP